MDVPTYQELLAKEYEQTARNLLVYHQEYEEEDVDEREEYDYDKQELEAPEEFNRVQERHDLKNIIQPKKEFEDKSKLSVRYNKDVKKISYNIDSRFRNAVTVTDPTNNSFQYQASSNFLFRLTKILKNIISVKLTSFEFPNTFYTFSQSRGNKSFQVTVGNETKTITLQDGNYLQSGSTTLIDYTALCADLTASLEVAFGIGSFLASYNASSNRIIIQNLVSTTFTMTFSSTTTISNLGLTSTNRFNGIGYFLGFQSYQYSGYIGYTSEACPQLIGDPYIYLSISDWSNIEHQDYNQTNFLVFCKILLTSGKNTMIFDTMTSNTTSKIYHFLQPTNINLLQIQLLDAFGTILDTQGANLSMTLEFEEVLNMALYEKYRDL